MKILETAGAKIPAQDRKTRRKNWIQVMMREAKNLLAMLSGPKRTEIKALKFDIKEGGNTSCRSASASSSMILAMENAGQSSMMGPASEDQGKRHRNERHPGGDL